MRSKYVIFIFIIGFLPLLALGAASDTTNPAPSGGQQGGSFFSWVRFFYSFLLSAAAILAVFMLVLAGVEMMTAVEKWRTDAKQRIWNAIIGLLLAALSFLILKTIHPQFKELKIQSLDIGPTNSNLKPEAQKTHFELVDGACRAVLGPGPDTCSSGDVKEKDFIKGYCRQGNACLPMTKSACENTRGVFSVMLETCKTGERVSGFCYTSGLCLRRNADQCANLGGSFSTNKNDVCK